MIPRMKMQMRRTEQNILSLFQPTDLGFFVDFRLDGLASEMWEDADGITRVDSPGDQIRRIQSLGPDRTNIWRPGWNYYIYNNNYPPSLDMNGDSRLKMVDPGYSILNGSSGMTVCYPFYQGPTNNGYGPFVINYEDFGPDNNRNMVLTECYDNGNHEFIVQTPAMNGSFWSMGGGVPSTKEQWWVFTGTFNCATGLKRGWNNKTLSLSSSWPTGNFGTHTAQPEFGAQHWGTTGSHYLPSMFFINRVLSDSEILTLQESMMRRVGLL